MQYFRRSRFLRSIVLLTLVTFLPACHKWVPLNRPFDQAITNDRPTLILVTDSDGVQTELNSPSIQAESVVGWDSDRRETLSVELADVSEIYKRETNALVTVLIVGSLVLVGAVAIAGSGSVAGNPFAADGF